MTDLYENNCKYLSSNLKDQINELNKIVIDYCIKKILIEIKSYLKYLEDSTSYYSFLDRPLNVNK